MNGITRSSAALVVAFAVGTSVAAGEGNWLIPAPVAEVNTENHELNPTLSPDGCELYLSSDRPGGFAGGFDVWVYRRAAVGEPFGAPQHVGFEINTPGNDIPCCLASDGLTLFISSEGDLYTLTRDDKSSPWASKKPIAELNTEHFEGRCSITADGRRLVFASDRDGGRGERDLWLAERRSEEAAWRVVRNLDQINTAGAEGLGSISSDGRVLFWTNQDAREIWCASQSDHDGRFENPRPLGVQVNNGLNVQPGISRDWPAPGSRLYWVRCLVPGNCDIYAAAWEPTVLPPAPPEALRLAGAGIDYLEIAWNDGSADEVVFAVERRDPQCRGFAMLASLPPNTQGYTDKGLTADTEYVYRVRAVGTGVSSPPSAELTARTLSESTSFLRGDCNDDGTVDISDAVCILNWLFLGGATPACVAVANTNGDEDVDLSDAVWLLNFLFVGGPAPAEPFPDCGPGTLAVDTDLGCVTPPKTCQP